MYLRYRSIYLRECFAVLSPLSDLNEYLSGRIFFNSCFLIHIQRPITVVIAPVIGNSRIRVTKTLDSRSNFSHQDNSTTFIKILSETLETASQGAQFYKRSFHFQYRCTNLRQTILSEAIVFTLYN